MGFKLITQVVLIIVSLVIISTFIKPSFDTIKNTQDELFQYGDTVAKAAELNRLLQSLVQEESSFSQRELLMLETFLPSSIDNLQVMKDITNILVFNNITVVTLSPLEKAKTTQDVLLDGERIQKDNRVMYQDFDMTFRGSYEELKGALAVLESNSYILEVVKLSFGAANNTGEASPEGRPIYSMTLRTYGLSPAN